MGVWDHIEAARRHDAAGDLFAARAEIERAKLLLPQERDMVHVLITSGIILRELGDTAAAITDLQGCIEHLQDYPDLEPVMSGSAWYNLGLALRQARRLPESISAYGSAIAIFRDNGLTNCLRMALQNRAWAFCAIGDGDAAQADLAESLPLCRDAVSGYQQRIGEAFALSITGRNAESVQICSELVMDTRTPSDVASHALWLSGRMALAAGALAEAEALVMEAVGRATKGVSDSRCLHDASELLAQVRRTKMNGGMAV